MSGPGSREDMFGDIPFDELLMAMRRGDNLDAWSDTFARIVARVTAVIRRRFPNAPFAEDAAQSAVRTFLGRYQAGRFELQGPANLVGLLVVVALRKANQYYRQRLRDPDPLAGREPGLLDPHSTVEESPQQREEKRQRLREEMDAELRRMLGQVEESLREGFHRSLLPYWFAREYEGGKMTREEIARSVGCSTATVDRAFRDIKQSWQPLVEEGRRNIQELAQWLG